MRTTIAAASFLLLTGCATLIAPIPSSEARSQLAPHGRLRFAVLTTDPVIARRVGAELTGTTWSLGRQLSAAVAMPGTFIEYVRLPALMEDGRRGAWDVAVLVVEPARSRLLDFAPPHMAAGRAQYAFAVPTGRPAAAAYVASWVEFAQASGAVQRAIDSAGLQNTVKAVPAKK